MKTRFKYILKNQTGPTSVGNIDSQAILRELAETQREYKEFEVDLKQKRESAKDMLGSGGGLKRYHSQMVIGPGTDNQEEAVPGERQIQKQMDLLK